MKNKKNENNSYKDYQVLKLHLTRSRAGVVALKSVSGDILAKAGGFGYDKTGMCFAILFSNLDFDTSKTCYTKFDLFNYSIENANQFLIDNKINYKITYMTSIHPNLSFIELSKID
jgi:hypothetical protein